MNALSLFDGIACGLVALKRSKHLIERYRASEINKTAIRVAKHNHPEISHIGDVRGVDEKADLILAGSPCQGFSKSGRGLNFEDSRSKLFFEFVRVLDKNPDAYFLLENVGMKKEWQDVISSYVGVEPVMLNSKLTSAQDRKRLYWANFPIDIPDDMGITLPMVVDTKMHPNRGVILGRRLNERGVRADHDKSLKMTQCLEVRDVDAQKMMCLTTFDKNTILTNLPKGRYPNAYTSNYPYRVLTPKERCRLMSLQEDYLDMVSYAQAVKLTGNAWEVNMITHILNQI